MNNNKLITKLILLFFLFNLTTNVFSENIYPTTVSSIEATVTLNGNGKITNLKSGQEVILELITFPESSFQEITVVKEELYINGKTILPEYILDEFGNKYVNFKIQENGQFDYVLKANVKTQARIKEMSEALSEVEEKNKIFINPTQKIESDSIEIYNVSKNKFSKSNYFDTLTQTVFWVNNYVTYASGDDFDEYYLAQKSAKETLLSRKGVCDEFANLAAGLLRVQKIPTKIAVGITYDGLNWGNHAWIETYNNNEWFPSDPTFGEVGFVDGTHIKIGSFDDISKSLATARCPSNASVVFNTQQKLPDVEIIKINYFNELKLESDFDNLKSKEWNLLKVKITNITDQVIIAPVKVSKKYSGIVLKDDSQQLILKPKETKEISFEIYPNIELNKNNFGEINLTINTLSTPFEKNVKIYLGENRENGKIIITDITPIITLGNLIVDFSVTNYRKTNSDINIEINEKRFVETINSFAEKKIRKEIPLDTNEYQITINSIDQKIVQNISLNLNKVETIQQDFNNSQSSDINDSITQDIEIKKDTLIDSIFKNPLIFIVIFIPILIFGLILFYLTRTKKYV